MSFVQEQTYDDVQDVRYAPAAWMQRRGDAQGPRYPLEGCGLMPCNTGMEHYSCPFRGRVSYDYSI